MDTRQIRDLLKTDAQNPMVHRFALALDRLCDVVDAQGEEIRKLRAAPAQADRELPVKAKQHTRG